MKKRLVHVSVLRAGIVFSAVSAVNALVFALPMFFFVGLATSLTTHYATAPGYQHSTPAPFGLMFGSIGLIIFPVFYAIFGFIFGVIGALVYNLVVKATGGLEFVTVDISAEVPSPALPPTAHRTGTDPY